MADTDLKALFADTLASPDQDFSHAVETGVSGRRRSRLLLGGALALAASFCLALLLAGIAGLASAWP